MVARRRPARTLVVLGSGGHTAEMLSLCRAMDASRYVPATFVVAATDHMSEARAEDTLLDTAWASHRDRCRFWRVPRAREVGQSWLSTMATTALACVHALGIITTVRPELILVNGPVRMNAPCSSLPRSFRSGRPRWPVRLTPQASATQGTCIPLCVAALGLEVLGLLGRVRIVYVESFCRVDHLSMTGKILFATRSTDRFLVQWEGLAEKLGPRAEFIGRLV
jgi:beta-1,4-N-acetylglucosaminyltransferase